MNILRKNYDDLIGSYYSLAKTKELLKRKYY
jgi:hypothetical protein